MCRVSRPRIYRKSTIADTQVHPGRLSLKKSMGVSQSFPTRRAAAKVGKGSMPRPACASLETQIASQENDKGMLLQPCTKHVLRRKGDPCNVLEQVSWLYRRCGSADVSLCQTLHREGCLQKWLLATNGNASVGVRCIRTVKVAWKVMLCSTWSFFLVSTTCLLSRAELCDGSQSTLYHYSVQSCCCISAHCILQVLLSREI